MKKYFRIIIISLCLIIFTIISIYVFKGMDIYLDDVVHEIIYNNIVSNNMTFFMKLISKFGNAGTVIIVACILLIVINDKKEKLYIILSLALSSLFNDIILKGIFRRDRPIYMMIEKSDYSYPSGHSMVSTVFYGYLIYLIYKNVSNKAVRNIIICLLCMLIVLICFSRIYLGVHYFTDVLGGVSIGIVFLMLFIKFSEMNKIFLKK